jgi:putative hydrolase of the HAD superfamily
MSRSDQIKCLFVDIGGVLLTNGWDHIQRKEVTARFGIDWEEFEERHKATCETFEQGRITLEEYLRLTVFFKDRDFTPAEFREAIFAQSQPFPEMIELVARLKKRYSLMVVVVSNEGREINEYRIHKYELGRIVDCFVSSSFVGLRKPDFAIFKLALDLTQTPPNGILYLENTCLFVEIAQELGIEGICHSDYADTVSRLENLGFDCSAPPVEPLTERTST